MTPPDDLDELQRKLRKRGFAQTDPLLHECAACNERGIAIYAISGKSGGRDIRLCLACGDAKSWRSVAGFESREPDPAFDLRKFLA
ncbi:MAG TPA: hypothetical protein VGL61_27170 [Kofleriaceae bacterium]|jgi:hypothetical protein